MSECVWEGVWGDCSDCEAYGLSFEFEWGLLNLLNLLNLLKKYRLKRSDCILNVVHECRLYNSVFQRDLTVW